MGQQEVISYLVKIKRPIEMTELYRKLAKQANETNIRRACRQLRKSNDIIVTPIKERNFVKFIIKLNGR